MDWLPGRLVVGGGYLWVVADLCWDTAETYPHSPTSAVEPLKRLSTNTRSHHKRPARKVPPGQINTGNL